MEKSNLLTLTLDQPFVAGTDDFAPFYNRLHKLNQYPGCPPARLRNHP